LGQVFRTISWTKKGNNTNGEKFNYLRFADNIIIIAHALNNIEVMLQELDNASKKCEPKVNMRNTDHGMTQKNNSCSICKWNPT